MSGGGIGGALEAVAPLALMAIPGVGEALAPLTASLESAGLGADAASAATSGLLGAVTSGGAAALTGHNPLKAALIGGLGGGLGSYALGPSGFGDAASGADSAITSSDLPAAQAPTLSEAGVPSSTPVDAGGGINPTNGGFNSSSLGFTPNLNLNGASAAPATVDSLGVSGGYMPNAAAAANSTDPSILAKLGKYALNDPLKAALAGDFALTGIQSLMPRPKVNVADNAAAVKATDPNFSNATLPAYHMQNTATPYTGNWYTYGETPQTTPLYSSQTVPGYARGGPVKGYAAGGPMMPQSTAMPQQAPAQAPSLPVNPLTLQVAHNVGAAIGKHLRSAKAHVGPGPVQGAGGGQADQVPAKLSQGEYVLSSDIPSALGDGSSEEGAKILDKFVKNVRTHKTSKGGKFPPKAHNPLAYLPKGSA